MILCLNSLITIILIKDSYDGGTDIIDFLSRFHKYEIQRLTENLGSPWGWYIQCPVR